jgi:D-glycero-alpha-D-manno-heptose-7-phosphate kinase
VIRATAWCRVDLGGGTLDIWPIGAMHPGSVTVNFAVGLPVTARLRTRASGYVIAETGGPRNEGDLATLAADPATALPALVAAELGLPPVEIRLDSASPRGAGLGGSSALTVALLAAGELVVDGRLRRSAEERARVARDLEARLMGLPTGMQDHLPGQLGGALAIEHRAGGERVRRLVVDLEALAARLVVAFTGQSHFSAGNNWAILRRRFEGDEETVARLEAIRAAAAALPAALESGDWPRVGSLVADEWEARRGLAPEVTTPELEAMLSRARELGAWGAKACGAGGGGSIAVLAPPERRQAIADALAAAGAVVLAAAPTARGLETATEDE